MRIDDLKQAVEIKPSVVELVRRVESETGKPVEVRLDKEMKAPVTVKIARERMPYHLLKVHPGQAAVAGYLVVNKCANILRMMAAQPSDRLVIATTPETLKAGHSVLERELGEKIRQFPSHIIEFWIEGLVNQLVNLPVQVRIERWVYATFPDLREEQDRYLKEDIRQTVDGVTEQVERVTPPFIFTTSNAMTYAFVRGAGEVLGSNFTQRYNRYPGILRRGKELYGLIGDDDDGSQTSDVRLINEWARLLGMDGWFVWQNFEAMPESYYADVV